MTLVAKAEASVPAPVWQELSADQLPPYVDMLRQGRLQGVEDALYSKRTLNLLKKARCQVSPANAECSSPTEVQ